MKVVKGFKVDDSVVKLYEELKQKEQINSDSDFFIRMLNYTKKAQKQFWLKRLFQRKARQDDKNP